jgi:hypothetical protein
VQIIVDLFTNFLFMMKKIGVWQDNWIICYDDTVNAARHVNNFLIPFFAELAEEERLCSVFQLDSATAHMAYVSLETLWKVFGDRIISHDLWLPCPPDLHLVTFICGEV